MIEFNIDGFPELERDLKALDFSTQRAVLNRAARAGAEPIRERASQLAPVETGTLREEFIVTGAGQRNDINSVVLLIGPSRKAFYGLFQEIGTAFAAAQPFLQPAFKQMEIQAINNIAAKLREQIDKAVRRGR